MRRRNLLHIRQGILILWGRSSAPQPTTHASLTFRKVLYYESCVIDGDVGIS
jgi:hypothetical protein